jgi:HEAT repeat protein
VFVLPAAAVMLGAAAAGVMAQPAPVSKPVAAVTVDGQTLEQCLATLRDQIRRGEREGRAATFARLAKFGAPAVPPLLEMATDRRNTDGASEARDALAAIGAAAAPAVVAALGAEEDGTFQELANVLLRIGPDAGPAVIAGLDARDARVRGRCAQVLMWPEFKADRTPAIPGLIRAARDGDAHARTMAVIALGNTRSPEPSVRAALQAAAGDAEERVRAQAVSALSRLPAPAAVASPAAPGGTGPAPRADEAHVRSLVAALADPSVTVQLAAVEALAKLGPAAEPAIDALKRVAETPEPAGRSSNVRHDAALALGKIGTPAAKALGELARRSDARQGALTALASLGQRGGDAAPDLAALVESPAFSTLRGGQQGEVIRVLGGMGPRAEAALATLRRLRTDPNLGAEARQAVVAIECSPLHLEPRVWKPVKPRIAMLRSGKPDAAAAARVRDLVKLRAEFRAAGLDDTRRDRAAAYEAAALLARVGDLEAATAATRPAGAGDASPGVGGGAATRIGLLSQAALAKVAAGDDAGATAYWDEALTLAGAAEPSGGVPLPPHVREMAMSRVRAGDLAGASAVLQSTRVFRHPENPSVGPQAPGRSEVMAEVVRELAERGEVDEAAAAALAVDEFDWRARSAAYAGHAALVRGRTGVALELFDEALDALRYTNHAVEDAFYATVSGRLRCDPDVAALIERLRRPSYRRADLLRSLVQFFEEAGRPDDAARASLALTADTNPAGAEPNRARAGQTPRRAATRLVAASDPDGSATSRPEVGNAGAATGTGAGGPPEQTPTTARSATTRGAGQATPPPIRHDPVLAWRAGRALLALDLERAAAHAADLPSTPSAFGEPPLAVAIAVAAAKLGDGSALSKAVEPLRGRALADALLSSAEAVAGRRPADAAALLRQAAPALTAAADPDDPEGLLLLRLRAAVLQAYVGDDGASVAMLAALRAAVLAAHPVAAQPAGVRASQRGPNPYLNLLARAEGRAGGADGAIAWIKARAGAERDSTLAALAEGVADRATGSAYEPVRRR